MEKIPLATLGKGEYNSLFTEQGKIELRIFHLIAELKARTTNTQFTNLLDDIEKIVLSYWDINSEENFTNKSKKFHEYKKQLSEVIEELKNKKNEYN
jgi:hypothetical protein